jgi:hypothetical protein
MAEGDEMVDGVVSAPSPSPMVRIRCITEREPWTTKGPMKLDSEEVVDRSLGELMQSKRQVVILGDA